MMWGAFSYNGTTNIVFFKRPSVFRRLTKNAQIVVNSIWKVAGEGGTNC